MRVTIAIPVLNEETVLDRTVRSVVAAARAINGAEVEIVIADNGSEDATADIGERLALEFPDVRYLRIGARGKGIAVRRAWESSDADVFAFMDADLATDLSALPRLVAAAAGSGGIAYGSRYHGDSDVVRSPTRTAVSRAYRAVVRSLLGTSVADAPCGFKAASRRVVRDVMPAVADDRWFFDTELVVRAERAGFPLIEVPVTWREVSYEGRRSKVNVPKVAAQYLRSVLRLRRDLRRP